jgi:hypothetical protein
VAQCQERVQAVKYDPEKSLLQLRREIIEMANQLETIETAKQLEIFKLSIYGLLTNVDGMIQAAQHAKTIEG